MARATSTQLKPSKPWDSRSRRCRRRTWSCRQERLRGQSTEELISGDPDGLHTSLFSFKGLPEKVQTAHGAVLTRDAGLIAQLVTFDGDEFINSETVVNKGPHPEADADFELFCDVIVPALS